MKSEVALSGPFGKDLGVGEMSPRWSGVHFCLVIQFRGRWSACFCFFFLLSSCFQLGDENSGY